MNCSEGNICVVKLAVYYACDLQNVLCCKSYGVTQYRWEVVPDLEDLVAFVLKGVKHYLAK